MESGIMSISAKGRAVMEREKVRLDGEGIDSAGRG